MPFPSAYFTKIHPDAIIPTYATSGSVACDLYLCEDVLIYPKQVVLARTGIVATPPMDYHWELCLRSSTAVKNPGLVQANSVGIIDSDYTGPEDEIRIPLLNIYGESEIGEYLIKKCKNWNKEKGAFDFKKGERIAQLILRTNYIPKIRERSLEKIKNKKDRGGFGSTGTK